MDCNSEKKIPGKKSRKTKHPQVEVHPPEVRQEDVFRFAEHICQLLKEAKKKNAAPAKPKLRKDGTVDKRSPNVNSIIKKKFPNTNGKHPRQMRVIKQVQGLNGKPRVSITPLSMTKITQVNQFVKEDYSNNINVIKDVLNEYRTHGRAIHKRPERHERNVLKTAKHEMKDAKRLARAKISKVKVRAEINRANTEKKQELKQVSRIG